MNELLKMDTSLAEKVKRVNQKKMNFQDTDIPSSYASLFIEYSINNDLESLKRALFIQWYAIAEPMEFTGIGELDIKYQKKNLFRIKETFLNNSYDSELLIMFKHYYNIADWYFDSFIEIKPFIPNIEILTTSILTKNRGVMGQYWDSILNNS